VKICWLHERTIFLVISGSRSYGFASQNSDWDYRGIAIPPLDSYIGLLGKFEQVVDSDKSKHVHTHYPSGLVQHDSDMQVMELCKFANLAAQCNPSIIEILFTNPDNFIIKHPVMDHILDNKHLFLSKMAYPRFCGYALSQLKRINRHKRWLDNPPTHKPTREDFGLPEQGLLSQDQLGAAEALIQKEINEFMIDQTHLSEDTKIELNNGLERMMRSIWVALRDDAYPVGANQKFESEQEALYWSIAKNQGYSDNFLDILNREKKYRVRLKEWKSYQTWLSDRNPKRAELEKKYNYDTKNATHLVRLIRMCREILTDGVVNVSRPDSDELLAIRNGAWTYEQVVDFAEKEEANLREVVKTSLLPKQADVKAIHKLIYNTILEFNKKDLDGTVAQFCD